MFLPAIAPAALAAAGLGLPVRPEAPVGAAALKGWYPLLAAGADRAAAVAAASVVTRADDRVLVAVPALSASGVWGVLASVLASGA